MIKIIFLISFCENIIVSSKNQHDFSVCQLNQKTSEEIVSKWILKSAKSIPKDAVEKNIKNIFRGKSIRKELYIDQSKYFIYNNSKIADRKVTDDILKELFEISNIQQKTNNLHSRNYVVFMKILFEVIHTLFPIQCPPKEQFLINYLGILCDYMDQNLKIDGFRDLFDSLNSFSNEIIKCDYEIKSNSIKKYAENGKRLKIVNKKLILFIKAYENLYIRNFLDFPKTMKSDSLKEHNGLTEIQVFNMFKNSLSIMSVLRNVANIVFNIHRIQQNYPLKTYDLNFKNIYATRGRYYLFNYANPLFLYNRLSPFSLGPNIIISNETVDELFSRFLDSLLTLSNITT